MVDDFASGWTEIEARRRWRDRFRAARRTAMCWHTWQLQQGIIQPGFILPLESAGATTTGDLLPIRPLIPTCPLFTGVVPPPRPRAQEARGSPFTRAKLSAKTKGSGGKGRGKGGQPEGKGGRKGACLGRGEYSRFAGYSEATSGAAPSAQFQESVPEGQAKGAPPEEPPSNTGGADKWGATASAKGYMPTAISQFTPAEIEEERRIAEEFNGFLDAFPAALLLSRNLWPPNPPRRPPLGNPSFRRGFQMGAKPKLFRQCIRNRERRTPRPKLLNRTSTWLLRWMRMADRLPSVVIRLITNRPRSPSSGVVLRHPPLRLLWWASM